MSVTKESGKRIDLRPPARSLEKEVASSTPEEDIVVISHDNVDAIFAEIVAASSLPDLEEGMGEDVSFSSFSGLDPRQSRKNQVNGLISALLPDH